MFVLLAALALGWALFEQYAAPQTEVPPEDQAILAETQQHAPDSLIRAADALGQLAVRERVSREGYARDQFSSGWAWIEGCDMRNRILQRDLEEVELDDDDCTVLSGVLIDDPFTGTRIPFVRGPDTSGDIHIEHLVAVSDAWQKGAQDLSREQRHGFYNDPLNLVAVDGPANTEKGDADASDWLPHRPYRCPYVARQVAIKLKYDLWVTEAEHAAMSRVLNTCPSQLLPIEREVVTP